MTFPQIQWLWLIPAFPLIGAVLNGLAGRRLGRTFTNVIGVGSILLSFLVVLYLTWSYGAHGPYPAPQEWIAPFNWIESGTFQLPIGFLLDPLSLVMVFVVTGVGLLIHIYSAGYMADDPGYNRYFAWLNLFTFSMLVLVLGNSFLILFVGWELVGLSSYLLIGFWYNRESATNAGKKAFIVNRVGDWAFVVGIILVFVTFLPVMPQAAASLRFVPLFQDFVGAVKSNGGLPASLALAPVIAALLFVGAMGKSAQLPLLHVWLPDAMEGPTPVSALIHAATMVTAGVYMVARCHPLFVFSPTVMHLVAWIGVFTAFFAASVALVQTDIKRVLAYSTISQLGYMFLGAGVGAFASSIFHLVTHAFFKGLLFLGAGAVIHALHNEQDMRNMGGLHRRLPWISGMMLVGVAAISGFPFLSGFVSKDLILSADAGNDIRLYIVGTATACITAFYMTRLWLMTFWGRQHWTGSDAGHSHSELEPPSVPPEPDPVGETGHSPDHTPAIHEPSKSMTLPMLVLAFLSLAGGALYFELPRFLEPVFSDTMAAVHEHRTFAPEWVLLVISSAMFFLGAGIAWEMYGKDNTEPKPWMKRSRELYRFLANAWYLDGLYHGVFAVLGAEVARFAYRIIELKVIDEGAVGGVAGSVGWVARGLRRVQSGVVGDYALAMAVGAACVLLYFLLR